MGGGLRRSLGLRDLVLYGIIVVQPTAPMPIFGVVHAEARGHVVSAVLIAMVAMLLTAISYGRMARAYPSAGSAFTYVGRELHPALGYLTGWAMAMDYLLNPLICTIWCARAALNIAPGLPYPAAAAAFALLFTTANLLGIRASARINAALAAAMGVVIAIFVVAALRALSARGGVELALPFHDPARFSLHRLFGGTSIAVLTYIGFDGISTLSEEVVDPRRNILRATVATCALTGVLAAIEVYLAQLLWPAGRAFANVDTAFVEVAGLAGGAWLYQLVNATLLVATMGSGLGAQLGAARLLYGMGRDDALPRRFFGALCGRGVPRNNVLLVGALALVGAQLVSYQLGAELLNFGAFVAFMGVNLAARVRYGVREPGGGARARIAALVPPALGLLICGFIWLNLRWPALVVGGGWLLLGLGYGVWRTRGFRRELVRFEIPRDT
jgi:amino acid transporter